MKTVLSRLFSENGYRALWSDTDVEAYTNVDDKVASFILVNYIDFSQSEQPDEQEVSSALYSLENRYIGTGKDESSIKKHIADKLDKKNYIASINKNTSAIYLLKVSDIRLIEKYRNLIYSVEESAKYFKRYILAYDENQLSGLKREIIESDKINENKTLQDIFTELSNNTGGYDSLMNGNSHDEYELVIRMFAKIPFLQYKFVPITTGDSLNDMVKRELNGTLKEYDKLLSKGIKEAKQYIDITEELSDDEINKIVDEYLGVNNG